MDMSSTIFFYTNNLLHRNLLRKTLITAVDCARFSNAKLLVTSHFPLFKEYIDVSSEFGGLKEDNLPEDYKELCIKDLNLDNEPHAINYVTGKLPYKPKSILDQLIFSCDHCNTDNIVLFEHDCFYPHDYVKIVEEQLKRYDITYCMEAYCMVNRKGFYVCEPHPYLSSFSGRRETFTDIFKKKKEMYGEVIRMLEPVVPCDLVLKDIKWTDGKEHMIPKILRVKTKYDGDKEVYAKSEERAAQINEIIASNSFCLDRVLGNECILEFQHGLNCTASLYLMRQVYDNSDMEEEYRKCSNVHPYWGLADKFTPSARMPLPFGGG